MAKKYKDADGYFLKIIDSYEGYALQWDNKEDGGGLLGDCDYPLEDVCEKAGLEAVLKMAQSLEKKGLAGVEPVIWFENLSDAKHALSLANEVMLLKQEDKKWPEWALTAISNGWGPPKGWKP